MNGVQTRLKCKPNVKRCKRFVFAAHSPLLHPNTLKTKAIIHFQTDHILTRFVFPPLYNTNDLSFKQDIAYQIKTGFAQTKDGTLWGANGNKLIKINVETLDYEEVELPNGLSVFYNQWAYTPTGLCASITENALYLVQMFEEGYSVYGKNIYKYNVETKNATLFFSAPAADKSVYGAGVQVDPRNGDVYIIYTEDGWSTHYLNTNIYIANGVTGTQKEVIDYTGTYWFPSTIAFQ